MLLYWLAPHGSSVCFNSSPGMAPPTMCWALPHQSLIMKMPYRPACSPILWRHSLTLGSLPPDNFGLCQADIKPSRTILLSIYLADISLFSVPEAQRGIGPFITSIKTEVPSFCAQALGCMLRHKNQQKQGSVSLRMFL